MNQLRHLFLAAAILTGISTLARATPVGCNSAGSTVIAALPVSCTAGDLTFTFTGVSYNPPAAGNSLAINFVFIVSGDVTLDFQITSGADPTYPLNVNLLYTVTSTSTDIDGIDAQFGADVTGSITENACSAPALTSGCPPSTTLSSLSDTSTAGANVIGTPSSFSPVSTLYIETDVDANFSEFANSILESAPLATPEPSTALPLAVLCGLAVVARLRRRR